VGHGPFPTQLSDEDSFLDHLQAREFGTTTGRKRRVGWFDGVMGREAAQLNGLNSIALTKLDILDNTESIQVCVGYELDGENISHVPAVVQDLERVKPLYKTVPGWCCSTADVNSYEELPDNAKDYIRFIENHCGVPISIVSLGPERHRTIIRNNPFTTK